MNGTLRDAAIIVGNLSSGDTLRLNTSRGVRWVVAGYSAGWESLGLLPPYLFYYPSKLGLGAFIGVQLWLILFLGEIVYSSMAILNMLPLLPFDGDKFLFYIVKEFAKTRRSQIRIAFNAIFFGIIAANVILSFVRYGSVLV